MGQYWKAVNLDKREFVHPHRLGCGLKLWEQLAKSQTAGGPSPRVAELQRLLADSGALAERILLGALVERGRLAALPPMVSTPNTLRPRKSGRLKVVLPSPTP